MSLDNRSLSVFLTSARLGSFGRAAAELNVTQPAVTRTVQRLEEHLGVPLFDRTTTGVVLNGYGQALLPHASLVVAEIGNAVALLDAMRGASRGVVRVGGVGSVISGSLAAALQRLLAGNRELEIHAVEEIEDKLLSALKAGAIDLAISPESYDDEEVTLACEETLHDHVQVFAPPAHPLAGRRGVTLEACLPHCWALPPADTPIAKEWRHRFIVAGLEPPRVSVASRSVNAIKSIAVNSGLLFWMPEALVAQEVADRRLQAIDIAAMDWRRSFRIYRRRKGILAPAAMLLLRELQRLVRDDPGSARP